jgi:hypothetical protein
MEDISLCGEFLETSQSPAQEPIHREKPQIKIEEPDQIKVIEKKEPEKK